MVSFPFSSYGNQSCGSLARREEMDQLVDLLHHALNLYGESNMRADQGRQVDAARKMPAVQGGDSEEDRELQTQNNRRSQEGPRFLAAEKRPAVQGGDSKQGMEIPSNRGSEEGPGQRPEVQGWDAVEMDAVMRCEMLRILVQIVQPGDQKEKLVNLLKHEEENQPHKQANKRQKQKVLEFLMQIMKHEKEMLAKLLKYAQESRPQKQENQQQKKNKKHHRKSRMALRKIALDKVKKSNVKKPSSEDKAAAYLAAWAEEDESESELEARTDLQAYEARLCRESWNNSFAGKARYGSYEDITEILPMRFTDHVDEGATPRETLQIFSVKVVETKEGVDWPLRVYGKLAVRDTVDHRRNIMFDRQEDNCQTVTKENPYLTLTGPSRAAVLSVHHSSIEAELKIKGSSSDSDDRDFSYLAAGYVQKGPRHSFIEKRVLSSRLSTLELTIGHLANSVEATIIVEVSSGQWPSGHGGVFTVSTASIGTMEIVLLAFEGDDGLPLEDNGKTVSLSRCVVGVEVDGRLNLSVKSLLPGGSSKVVLTDERVFTPKESGRSQLMLKVGSCEMKVTVAWSLLLAYELCF